MDERDVTTPANRMAQPIRRGPGRPRKNEPREPSVEATLLVGNVLPPMICPKCQRGMQPTVRSRGATGVIYAKCGANGCQFIYTPPRVRIH